MNFDLSDFVWYNRNIAICTLIKDHSAKNSYIIRLGQALSILRTRLRSCTREEVTEQGIDFDLIQIQYGQLPVLLYCSGEIQGWGKRLVVEVEETTLIRVINMNQLSPTRTLCLENISLGSAEIPALAADRRLIDLGHLAMRMNTDLLHRWWWPCN